MITLPRWLARIGFVRRRIFHPKITLRQHPFLHVVRYGLLRDGKEFDLGTTLVLCLDDAKAIYARELTARGVKYAAPLVVEGSDYFPLPALDPAPTTKP